MKQSLFVRLGILFLAVLILSILPLPAVVSSFRPPWVLLLVLFLEYYLPGYFKLVSLIVIGLLLDVLLSTVIGEHAFALLLVTWIASTKSRRFQFFSMMQQMALVGIFCMLYQSIILLIDGLLGFQYNLLIPLASGCLGMLLWPWIRVLGDGVFVSFRRFNSETRI